MSPFIARAQDQRAAAADPRRGGQQPRHVPGAERAACTRRSAATAARCGCVLLPHESHGYAARESVEHTLHEMIALVRQVREERAAAEECVEVREAGPAVELVQNAVGIDNTAARRSRMVPPVTLSPAAEIAGTPIATASRCRTTRTSSSWIATIVSNLQALFRANTGCVRRRRQARGTPSKGQLDRPQRPRRPESCSGRPEGPRSYQQWKEGDIPVTVAFEILSPGTPPTRWPEAGVLRRLRASRNTTPTTRRRISCHGFYRRGALLGARYTTKHNHISPAG